MKAQVYALRPPGSPPRRAFSFRAFWADLPMPMKPPVHRPPGWKPAEVKRVEYDRARGSARERGYDRAWEQNRAAFLKAHPRCVSCGAPSKHADHILARAKGGSDAWSNLQPLCASCHSAKTARHDGGFGNPRR